MTDPRELTARSQQRSARNMFASLIIDRAPRRRRDEAWVADRLKDPVSRFLPVWGSEVLVTLDSAPSPGWMDAEEADNYLQQAESVILLGEIDKTTYFAIGLPTKEGNRPKSAQPGRSFRPLRAVASLLEQQAAGMLAYGTAMVHYHHDHRFCGVCGAPTLSAEGGHLRVCSDARCGQQEFPRTDPAIIVLVSSGNRCLLARQPTWQKGLYSVIAGFVEPGESLEAAVAREVAEETGVQVTDVQYHSSQPWPFPRSLMIGFRATAETTTICLSDGELEDARWLSREEIAEEVRGGTLELPSPISISYRLLDTWYEAEGKESLRELRRA